MGVALCGTGLSEKQVYQLQSSVGAAGDGGIVTVFVFVLVFVFKFYLYLYFCTCMYLYWKSKCVKCRVVWKPHEMKVL